MDRRNPGLDPRHDAAGGPCRDAENGVGRRPDDRQDGHLRFGVIAFFAILRS
jgi:hypothetical protein